MLESINLFFFLSPKQACNLKQPQEASPVVEVFRGNKEMDI